MGKDRQHMRDVRWIMAGLMVGIAVLAVRAQQVPATPPSTIPAGTIRGHVSIRGGSLFQRPDLSRVVVYLASDPKLDGAFGPTTRATVAQRDKSFVPNFLVVPRGTEVEFPNWDHFDHNVFSRSAAAPAFDLERYPYGQSKTRVFDKLGVVQVFCNIHPAMRAVIFVTPNTLFVRADRDGNFQIAGVPAGSFEVVTWHDRCEEQRQTVQVDPDHPTEIEFKLRESRERVMETVDERVTGEGSAYGVERGLGVKQERLDLPVVHESHPAAPESKP
jgi:plastocyanin